MAFFVGQKVVCVDDQPEPNTKWYGHEGPKAGVIYTIRRYYTNANGDGLVWLNEITRDVISMMEHGPTVGYSALRFRPVTDISALQSVVAHIKNGGKPKEFGNNPLDHTRQKART